MTPEEIQHLESTVTTYFPKDNTWKKAFREYNSIKGNRKVTMNCRPCYYKVLMYFKNQ